MNAANTAYLVQPPVETFGAIVTLEAAAKNVSTRIVD